MEKFNSGMQDGSSAEQPGRILTTDQPFGTLGERMMRGVLQRALPRKWLQGRG